MTSPSNDLSLRTQNTSYSMTNSPSIEKLIPKEILQLILFQLSAYDLVQFGLATPHIYTRIFPDPLLWDFLLERCFPGLYVDSQSDAKHPLEVYKHLTCVENNMRTGTCEVQTLTGHKGRVRKILMNGDQLITTSIHPTIKMWDLISGKELQTLTGHTLTINNILIYRNKLISTSIDRTIRIWDLASGKEPQTLRGHSGMVISILVHKNKLISASDDHTIKIWNLENGDELKTLTGHQDGVIQILMHGEQLISSSKDCTIRIWDLEKGKELQILTGHIGPVKHLLIYGKQLISAAGDGKIKIWNLENGQLLQTLTHPGYISQILVYKDQLISASSIGTIKIWDLETYQLLQMLRGHKDWVNQILVHGNLLISASDDATIKIWDLENGQLLQTLTDHKDKIRTILMDRGKLISASEDLTIKIWDFGVPSSKNLAFPKKQSLKQLASLLTALGIYDCSTQLQVRSCFLEDIGIFSLADIEALGLSLHDFQHLIALDAVKEEDHNKRQTQALAKSDPIFILLQTLLDAVDQRIRESMNCTLPPYENDRDNPWIALREELIDYLDKFKHECGARVTLLEKFESGNYKLVINEVNGLVDRFKVTDCEHRIARLRTYVGQHGLNLAWGAIHKHKIDSLAALVERRDIAPQDFFAMGI